MIDETTDLLHFGAVCEKKSMVAASKMLGCSPAQVSRKISRLEERLGTKLFHRTTRKLMLTDAGEALKNDALSLLQSVQIIQKKSEGLRYNLKGSFVITAPTSLATYLIAPLIPKLQKEFPDINFELIPTNKNLNLINDGIDLAIRTGNVIDKSLVAHQIGLAKNVFYASNLYIESNGCPEKIVELDEHNLIVNAHSETKGVIDLYDRDQLIIWKPNKWIKINLYTIIMDLVSCGAGIGYAPDYCMAHLEKSGKITRVLKDCSGSVWPIYVVYPFLTPIPAKTAKISNFIRERFKLMSTTGYND